MASADSVLLGQQLFRVRSRFFGQSESPVSVISEGFKPSMVKHRRIGVGKEHKGAL